MATLPTEQDIGDLPDRLPRRMGVGSWQPGDLARGAQQLAMGGERLGQDLGMYAAHEQNQQNEADLAKAQSIAAVSHIKTAQDMTNETDPIKVAAYKDQFQTNLDNAASVISDPNVRAKFTLSQAPDIARYQVGADDRVKGLVKNQEIANFDQTSTGLINSAVGTEDEGQRAAAIAAIKANGQSLVSRGILTPEEWQGKAHEVAHGYASARVESEIARAKATGDTSRLQDLSKLFQFNPGEWSAAPAGGAQPAGPMDAPATRIASYDQPIQTASQKYGVSPSFLAKTIYIESRGNPDADNGFARGLAQFSDKTAAQYGVNQKDAGSSIDGAAHYAFDNAKVLTTALGRAPTDAELYLAHQQDGSGAAKLLTNPNTPAGQLVNPKAISANGGDPNAPAKQFTDMWIKKFNATPSYIGDAAGGTGSAPGSTPSAANSYFIGDSIADQLKRAVPGAAGNTLKGRPPAIVQNIIANTDPADFAGKTVYLSSGAANAYDPKSIAAVEAQITTLTKPIAQGGKGVDPSQIRLAGVGDRADFASNKVNDQLAAIAKRTGVTFAGPMDPANLRHNPMPGDNSDDGVHFADARKGLIQLASTGATAQPGAPSAFVGLPPPGAMGANPHLVPPKDQWPAGATGVQHNADGSIGFVMDDGRTITPPGSRASGAAGAPSPTNTGTLLDALKPQERGELGLRLQNEISAIERQKSAADNQYEKAAVADMKSRVENMTEGRPLGPNETASLQPYSTSPNPNVRTAYATMMAVRNNLSAYQGQSPAIVQADIAKKQAEYNHASEAFPNDPGLDTMKTVLDASVKFAKSYQAEATKAPLERASLAGFLPDGIQSINPSDPNSLARRVVDAHTAAENLGVPVKYFQQSERPMLKRIAQEGGQPMVDFATNIVKTAGPDAPAIFKEIGVDAPMFQKIGELAANGGDPEAVSDIASIINARNDKTANRDIPTFTDKMLSKYDDPLPAAAARMGADFTGRTRAAANMLMSAQAGRDGWDPKTDPNNANFNQQFFDRAYNLAVGGTYGPDGTQYGGLTDRNAKNWFGSKDQVIVPNTIKAKDFGGVINSITDADLKDLPTKPMGANGAPITASQIQNGKLEPLPDNDGIFRGKYAVFTDGVLDDNHLVRDGSGKPWALDLAQPQLDAALRGKNPNSFLVKPPQGQPAAPDRYRSTPGMVALTGAAETE